MSAVRIVALSSSAAADLAGKPHLQSTGHFELPGSCNGSHRSFKTNLQVHGSRLSILRHDPRPSGGVTVGGNTVHRKLQACLAARNVRCDSQVESSSVATADVPEKIPDGTIDERLAEGQQVSLYDTPTQEQNPRGLTGDKEPHPYEDVYIGASWREVQGENNWEGMLDPLDDRLRSELIRNGELAQSTYDSFYHDEYSKYCGCCKYIKKDYFHNLGLKNRGYEIVEYIYTTSPVQEQLSNFFKSSQVTTDKKWSSASNWAGFIAVCTSPKEIARLGRRDIVIAWRGTVTKFEWVADLDLSLCPTAPDPWAEQKEPSSFGSSDLRVERGFLSLYESTNKRSKHNDTTSAKAQVRRALKWLMKRFKGEQMSITVTGHSLGAALATLCAYDIGEFLHHEQEGGDLPMVTAFVYGCPRVGNSAFKREMEKRNVKVLRVTNVHDFIPCVPGLVFHEKPKFMWMYIPSLRKSFLMQLISRAIDLIPATYSEVGVELEVDNLQSPFIKPTRNPDSAHNLELYLHLLAGLKSKEDPFSEALCTRDLALVNKSASLLASEHAIPGAWFQEENKGLVRIGGRFRRRPILHEDFPEQPLDENAFDKELHYIK